MIFGSMIPHWINGQKKVIIPERGVTRLQPFLLMANNGKGYVCLGEITTGTSANDL
jgi:hypothetical protein